MSKHEPTLKIVRSEAREALDVVLANHRAVVARATERSEKIANQELELEKHKISLSESRREKAIQAAKDAAEMVGGRFTFSGPAVQVRERVVSTEEEIEYLESGLATNRADLETDKVTVTEQAKKIDGAVAAVVREYSECLVDEGTKAEEMFRVAHAKLLALGAAAHGKLSARATELKDRLATTLDPNGRTEAKLSLLIKHDKAAFVNWQHKLKDDPDASPELE
jgi:hypothetical protein